MNNNLQNFNFFDRILGKIFKRYTEKVYRLGIIENFNFENTKRWEKFKK